MFARRNPLASNNKVILLVKRAYSTAESEKIRFDLDQSAFKLYVPPGQEQSGFAGPQFFTTATKKECLDNYRMMQLIRRFEINADLEYKERKIRGFCHLYDGQEAVATGIEWSSTRDDHVITAYRDHAHQILRGDSARRTMAELMGKGTGCSAGKGGSMHMYLRSGNFFGGNGIVGAQVPVGAGLAFALKYMKDVMGEDKKAVAWASYGDGASNQGQIFEAFNMSALWKLPCIFVCENNKYGMGTSVKRSSASTDYYTRGQFIPGIRVDGQDIFAVKEAARYAKEWALENGPLVLEFETYRYHGHSMSDPGITYRSRDEIKEYRTNRDPIMKMRNKLLEKGIATEEELKAIDKEAKEVADDAVKFAHESPFPEAEEVATHIYYNESYVAKGRSAHELHYVKSDGK